MCARCTSICPFQTRPQPMRKSICGYRQGGCSIAAVVSKGGAVGKPSGVRRNLLFGWVSERRVVNLHAGPPARRWRGSRGRRCRHR
jgi:hypothetical protein